MLVGPDGEAVGSVSGGCVEGAVYELAQEVVADGDPVLQRYGVSDDDAFAVGLTCGGILDVFVEPVSPRDLPRARRGRRRHRGRRPGGRRDRHRAPGPGVGRPAARRAARGRRGGRPRRGRWARRAPTPRWPTTSAACSPPGAPRPSPTARTASAAARGCGSSSRPSRRGPGCSSSARSTSRRRWPGSAPSSATSVTVCDARPGVRDDRAASRRPTRWSCEWPHQYLAARGGGRADRRADGGLRAHPRPEVRRAAARGRAAAARRSPTSARWARGAPTRTGWRGCARPGSPRPSWPGCPARSGSTSAPGRPEETAVSIAAEIVALRWGGRGDRLQRRGGPIHHHADRPERVGDHAPAPRAVPVRNRARRIVATALGAPSRFAGSRKCLPRGPQSRITRTAPASPCRRSQG